MNKPTRWAPGASALGAAAQVVARVAFEGLSADDALERAGTGDVAERPAVRAIALGSIRWFLRLLPAMESLLERPQATPPAVRALLVCAAHQIEYSRNIPQATVHAAVDATRILGAGKSSGLVNAVLRRFLAERGNLLAKIDTSLAARHAHPQWLVEAIERAWPESVESILTAANRHPPLVLRIDLGRIQPEKYLNELASAGIEAELLPWCPSAIHVVRPVPVARLPGFETGLVSVQDAGAQLAAPLLDVRAGARVLDCCAAPGGKTGHLLEISPNGVELTSVDVDPSRTALIEETVRRLGRAAAVKVADVLRPESFWDGRPFDRILVDAPCSSTGVIRRHPDIKLLRRATDIPAFARLQADILAAAFRLLAPGGRLLYATCSILPAENEEVVAGFLATEPAARVAVMPRPGDVAPGATQRRIGIQLIPGIQAGTDGFYYACLEKTTVGT